MTSSPDRPKTKPDPSTTVTVTTPTRNGNSNGSHHHHHHPSTPTTIEDVINEALTTTHHHQSLRQRKQEQCATILVCLLVLLVVFALGYEHVRIAQTQRWSGKHSRMEKAGVEEVDFLMLQQEEGSMVVDMEKGGDSRGSGEATVSGIPPVLWILPPRNNATLTSFHNSTQNTTEYYMDTQIQHMMQSFTQNLTLTIARTRELSPSLCQQHLNRTFPPFLNIFAIPNSTGGSGVQLLEDACVYATLYLYGGWILHPNLTVITRAQPPPMRTEHTTIRLVGALTCTVEKKSQAPCRLSRALLAAAPQLAIFRHALHSFTKHMKEEHEYQDALGPTMLAQHLFQEMSISTASDHHQEENNTQQIGIAKKQVQLLEETHTTQPPFRNVILDRDTGVVHMMLESSGTTSDSLIPGMFANNINTTSSCRNGTDANDKNINTTRSRNSTILVTHDTNATSTTINTSPNSTHSTKSKTTTTNSTASTSLPPPPTQPKIQIKYTFLMGLEGTGHHFYEHLLHTHTLSPSMAILESPSLKLKPLLMELQNHLFHHFKREVGLFSAPFWNGEKEEEEEKFGVVEGEKVMAGVVRALLELDGAVREELQNQFDRQSPPEAVEEKTRKKWQFPRKKTSPPSPPPPLFPKDFVFTIPLNCGYESINSSGELSYPNYFGPYRTLQYPQIHLLHQMCQRAHVWCEHTLLTRDVYEVMRSTVKHRQFADWLVQWKQSVVMLEVLRRQLVDELVVLEEGGGELARSRRRRLGGCIHYDRMETFGGFARMLGYPWADHLYHSFHDTSRNTTSYVNGTGTTLNSKYPENERGFLTELHKLYQQPSPVKTEEDKRAVVPEEFEVYMSYLVELNDKVEEVCYKVLDWWERYEEKQKEEEEGAR